MVREMKDVLQLLGWGDGFKIPVANEENKILEAKVEELLKKKAEAIVNLEVINEKEEAMKKNLKALEFEKEYNQKLMNGLSKQLETDMKLMKDAELSQNEKISEIKSMKKSIKKMEEQIDKCKIEINNNSNKMNILKESLQWGEDALFAWQEEIAKGERETDILKLYKLQDEDKFQKLDLERKQVQTDLNEAEELEKREADRHRILSLQLENVSKLYKEAYNERERLMKVWHDSIDICHSREEEIKRLTEILCEIKNRARNKCSELYEQQKFYDEIKSMNESLVKENTKIRLQSQKLKDAVAESENNLKFYISERDLAKKTAGNVSGQFEAERNKNSELQSKNKARYMKLNKLIEAISNLQQQCDVLKVDTLTNEQKFRNAQDMYEMSCRASEEEAKELERLHFLSLQLKQEINKYKELESSKLKDLDMKNKFEKDLEIKIENIKEDIEITRKCIIIVLSEEAVLKQKIAELQDKCSGKEEKEEVEAETKELEPQESQLIKEKNQLNCRLKSLQKEYQDKISRLRNGEDELKTLKELYKTKKLYLQADKNTVEDLKEDIQKNRLQLNLLSMREHCIKENIARDDSTVCKLERQRDILETAMKDRQREIEAQKDVLVGKKRSLLEEKAMLGRTVEHLNVRLRQIQSRYGVALDLLGKDDSGKQLSVAHFKIKLAQEKYELQLEGDDLEAKINKTEKEILAMENTLKLITAANENYKVSLEAVDDSDPDMIEKERMEQKYSELKKIQREDNEFLDSVKNEIEGLISDISKVKCIAKELEEDWKLKEKEVTNLEKDLAVKQLKLNRATALLVKLMRDIRRVKEPPVYKRLAQREIDVKIQEERNRSVLQQLGELSINYVETKPLVNRYISEYGLKIPHKTASTRSNLPAESTNSVPGTARSRTSMRSDSSIASVVNLDPGQLFESTPPCFQKKENKYMY